MRGKRRRPLSWLGEGQAGEVMPMPSFRAFLVLVALSAPGHGPAAVGDAAADLKDVNEACRAAYRAAREGLLERCGPVVLWNGEELVFRYGRYRRVSRPTTAVYHDLKTVGHVVLGLYAL